jgi:hypothetical protein
MSIIRNGSLSADLDVPVVLPTLNLDFANSQSLDKRITFSRGSIGTRVNRNGLIETIAANQPRFDFDPISGECRGLLIEEQRTNLVTYSDTITTSNVYNGVSSQLTQVTTTTPISGLTTATKVFLNVGANAGNSSNGFNFGTFSLTNSTVYTQSIFVKASGSSIFRLRSNVTGQVFDIPIAGPAPTPTGTITACSVTLYADGWSRISWTFTSTTSAPGNRGDHWAMKPTVADGSSGFFVTGAQLEQGASPSEAPFPTSYIPTSGSTVTRSPDLARLQDPYFSQIFNKYEGSVFMNYNMNSPVDNGTFYGLQRSQTLFYIGNISDGTYNGYGLIQDISISIRHRLSGQAASQSSFVGIGIQYTSGSPITNGKFCFSYDADKLKVSCDKLKSVSFVNRRGTNNQIQSITTQVFNEITIGWGNFGGASNRYITGTIKKLQFYPKSLNDAEMSYLVN